MDGLISTFAYFFNTLLKYNDGISVNNYLQVFFHFNND